MMRCMAMAKIRMEKNFVDRRTTKNKRILQAFACFISNLSASGLYGALHIVFFSRIESKKWRHRIFFLYFLCMFFIHVDLGDRKWQCVLQYWKIQKVLWFPKFYATSISLSLSLPRYSKSLFFLMTLHNNVYKNQVSIIYSCIKLRFH